MTAGSCGGWMAPTSAIRTTRPMMMVPDTRSQLARRRKIRGRRATLSVTACAAAVCRSGFLFEGDTRVEDCIHEIHDKVDGDHQRGNKHHQPLHQRHVPVE